MFVERCGLFLTRWPPEEAECRAWIGRWLQKYGHPPAGYGDKAIRFHTLGPSTRAALWEGVWKALAYPRSMMYHDAGAVAAALNGLLAKKMNLTARFGPRNQQAFFKAVGADLPYRFVDQGVPDDDED